MLSVFIPILLFLVDGRHTTHTTKPHNHNSFHETLGNESLKQQRKKQKNKNKMRDFRDAATKSLQVTSLEERSRSLET